MKGREKMNIKIDQDNCEIDFHGGKVKQMFWGLIVLKVLKK